MNSMLASTTLFVHAFFKRTAQTDAEYRCGEGLPSSGHAETVVANHHFWILAKCMLLKFVSSGAAPEWGTATERWRRNGAFSETKVLEDVISASRRGKQEYLHGEQLTAA